MISRAVAAIALLLLGTAAAQEGKLKIATVDIQRLYKEYYRTAEAQKEINVELAKVQKDGNERREAIRKLDADVQSVKKQLEDPSVAVSKKQKIAAEGYAKQQDGVALERECREYLERRKTMLGEKMAQSMQAILAEIRKLVEEKAKEEGYDYVFDKSGSSTSQVPFFLYAKDENDITAILLEDLNRDRPAAKKEAGDEQPGEIKTDD